MTQAMRVYLLGRFEVVVRGRTIPDDAWRRRKARQLFKCLLSRPRNRLVKDEAIELLWPESDPEAASTNLRSALHAIRRALEEAGEGDVVLLAGKGHETYQEIADRTIAFDDREVAAAEIRAVTRDHAP